MVYNCDDMPNANTVLASITVFGRTKMSANKRGRTEAGTVFFFIKVSPLSYCERNLMLSRVYFLLPTFIQTVIVLMQSCVPSESSINL